MATLACCRHVDLVSKACVRQNPLPTPSRLQACICGRIPTSCSVDISGSPVAYWVHDFHAKSCI
ncbi:hypothetical protein Csa_017469 [Cucumis sativus]|uniref:Uncharacterized protein n=1 Tax=Cucumis sativus TaxID=3659 RepID=A0A0A0LDM2_CUCSA|nr:hypothetical protein Csa_017469 [Cucumis sativus]